MTGILNFNGIIYLDVDVMNALMDNSGVIVLLNEDAKLRMVDGVIHTIIYAYAIILVIVVRLKMIKEVGQVVVVIGKTGMFEVTVIGL